MWKSPRGRLAILAAAIAIVALPRGVAAQEKNIVEIAQEAGSFNTLVAAVEAAGLVEALSAPGPLTVFAPTDEAFAKIPQAQLNAILADKELLTSILTYHVVAGRVTANDVVNLDFAPTLNGQRLDVSTSHGVQVDEANVVTTDIMASNGVIHVIDAVLVPETRNIAEVAREAGSFGTLLTALEAADLTETIAGGGPYTVLAPTDEAFAKIPAEKLNAILADKELLTQILTYHVVEGVAYADQVARMSAVSTLNGKRVHVASRHHQLHLNDAHVVAADIAASNGVIHVIDEVLVP